MTITTENKEKYEKEIKKYFSEKKKWDTLKRAVNTLFKAAIICLAALYVALGVFFIIKIMHGDTELFKKLTIILSIAFLLLFVLAVTIEHFNFSMSTRARLWNIYKKNEQEGFLFEDINLWFDSDKIYAHLIFRKGEDSKIAFMRLDEFIVGYEDIKEPRIELDKFYIAIPEKDKEKKNIMCD